ncbi:MAG: YbaN family protein [Pseudomonadales bacterium]|nr:YbaN family protein [Pseudomonadales bacterium]
MLTPLKKVLLVVGGCLSLVLGVIGAFVPLLPTVPLVLLAGFCFARSSDRLHNWLLNHPYFGVILRNFEAGKGIPRKIKIRAIVMVWISMGLSCWIVDRLVLCLMLFAIGLSVSVYLWRQPEYQVS